MFDGTAPRLPKYLAASCALLIAYACLYPFAGWQASGLPLFDYLAAPWPKYLRTEDLVVNVLGYVPLGFLLVPALPRRWHPLAALLVASLLGTLFSFGIETAQHFLPTRVSSNVDLGCNALGALLGAAAGALFGRGLFDPGGGIHRWRAVNVVQGRSGDLGLILLGLWLLAQSMPDSALFAAGDLRRLFGLPTPMPFQPRPFITLEAAMVATGLFAVGLFARCMLQASRVWPALLLLVLGIAVKSGATSIFVTPGDAWLWLTPGTRNGLIAGAALLLVALMLPRVLQHALAGMALLGTATLANLIPENPYLLGSPRLISGTFENFHGLVRLVSGAWPLLALAWLSALGLWRGEHLHDQ
ncbi:MAG: VanZ family protein [Pseudazoarcus pumilus]|nr:VanZ family protein [Pseudazoarcus pumilus]